MVCDWLLAVWRHLLTISNVRMLRGRRLSSLSGNSQSSVLHWLMPPLILACNSVCTRMRQAVRVLCRDSFKIFSQSSMLQIPRCEAMVSRYCEDTFDEMNCRHAMSFCADELYTPLELTGMSTEIFRTSNYSQLPQGRVFTISVLNVLEMMCKTCFVTQRPGIYAQWLSFRGDIIWLTLSHSQGWSQNIWTSHRPAVSSVSTPHSIAWTGRSHLGTWTWHSTSVEMSSNPATNISKRCLSVASRSWSMLARMTWLVIGSATTGWLWLLNGTDAMGS